MGKLVDRTGLRYGDLTVLHRDDAKPSAADGMRVFWVCKCDCGNTRSIAGHDLQAGSIRSCGCKHRVWVSQKKRSHGHTRQEQGVPSPTKTYYSWQAAKARCHDPSNTKYPEYGGRGITMCERWRNSFEAFLTDMGERPANHTIDRIDGSKGYEPGNCRWATHKEQAQNREVTHKCQWRGKTMTLGEVASTEGIPRTSLGKRFARLGDIEAAVAETKAKIKDPKHLTYKGETLSRADWAARTGIPKETIRSRLRIGWSVEKTLTTPYKS